MDTEERHRLAQDRAEVYAPAPTGGAIMAGVCGAVVALVGDFAVSGFYGWAVSDHLGVAAAVAVAGFLAAWIGYLRLARINRRATRAERRDIDQSEGPTR